MLRIIVGLLLCLMSACNVLEAVTDKNTNAAVGAGAIALVLFLAGVPLLITGLKRVFSPAPATAALRPCPFCAEPIQPKAVVCRFCNREVPAVPS